MLSDRTILMHVYFYLNDDDKLTLSSTTKSIRFFLKSFPRPNSKKTFFINVSGFFHNQETFISASKYYLKIIHENNINPAVLYRLNDKTLTEFLKKKQDKEGYFDYISGENGCIYAPDRYRVKGVHNWAINYTWTQANITLGRSFLILSKLTDENCWRKKNNAETPRFCICKRA